MLVEICVDSLASALAACEGGADRIELCSALELGGLTPSAGLLKLVKKQCNIPVFCMIRCRGGDFVYSDSEMTTMLEDIESLKGIGADGFVFGALTTEWDIEINQCQAAIAASQPLPMTFHRAFDHCRNWQTAIDCIITAGFKTLLTSGQQKTALEGSGLLAKLTHYAKGRIYIMAGSGITVQNVTMLLRQIRNLNAIHTSASLPRKPSLCLDKDFFSLGIQDGNNQKETSLDLVLQLVKIANSYHP